MKRTLGRAIYEAAVREGLVQELRGWDERRWTDGEWQCRSPGLSASEKAMWERVAQTALRAVTLELGGGAGP